MRKEQAVLSQLDSALDYFFEQTILVIDDFWSTEDGNGHITRIYLDELFRGKRYEQINSYVMARLFSLTDKNGRLYLPYSDYVIPCDLYLRGITWDTIVYDNPFELQATIGGAYISSFFNDSFSSELECGIVGCAVNEVFPNGCEIDNRKLETLIDFRTHADFLCECISKSKILALRNIGAKDIGVCLRY